MNGPNLVAAFHQGLADADVPRGDDEGPHVSDLAKCRLAVWARRNGRERVQRSPITRARLQSGLRDEAWIIDLIIDPLLKDGWDFQDRSVLNADLIGHWDIVLSKTYKGADFRCVVDIKTSEWRQTYEGTGEYGSTGKEKRRKIYLPYDDAPGRAAILQVVGYARRLPLNPDGKHPPAAIMQYCRRSFQMAQFPSEGGWWDTDEAELVREHDEETREVLEQTAPGVDPLVAGIAMEVPSHDLTGTMLSGFPPMDTVKSDGSSWACMYCEFAGCARNANYDAEMIA